jgi:hypothetical protein
VEQINELKFTADNHNVQLSEVYTALENLLDEKMEKKKEDRKSIGFNIKNSAAMVGEVTTCHLKMYHNCSSL